ncbi:MAG: imidazole glycerol phosphate synthase subunit HisH [Myxococcota bacterium]
MSGHVTVVDYGAGNMRSITNALKSLGADVNVVHTASMLPDTPARVVVPGVGAFGAAIDQLRTRGFVEPLRHHVAQGWPLLGICVGYQLLFETSNELGQHEGLGLVPGHVRRFTQDDLIVPHMGWNEVSFHAERHPMLTGYDTPEHFYFVHSYYPEGVPETWMAASTTYGAATFASGVAQGNVSGFQFHPEKSGPAGLELLERWLTAAN